MNSQKLDPPKISELLRHIENSPDLHNLLQDIDWLPEQLEIMSADWTRMMILAERHKQLWSNNKP